MTTKTYPSRATGPAPATLEDLVTELLTEDGHDPTDEAKREECRQSIAEMVREANAIRKKLRDDYYAWRLQRGRRLCLVHRQAIQGDNGSGTTFSLAVALVRGLVLKMEDALKLLDEVYSPRCVPPWSYNELVHKVEDAEYKSDAPWGFLLRERTDVDGDQTSDQTGADENDPRREPRPEPRRENVATGEIVGVHGTKTKTVQRDVDGLQLRVLDGPFAGSERRLQLDWPPTSRSVEKWNYLARAVGLDTIRDPRRELFRRRIGVELLPDPQFKFRVGNSIRRREHEHERAAPALLAISSDHSLTFGSHSFNFNSNNPEEPEHEQPRHHTRTLRRNQARGRAMLRTRLREVA